MKTPPILHEHGYGFRIWRGKVGAMKRAHSHSDIEFNFLLRGEMSYLYGGGIYKLPARRLVVMWGGVPHHLIHHARNSQAVWVTLPLAWLIQLKLPIDFQGALLGGRMQFAAAEDSDHDQRLLTRWADDFQAPGSAFKSIVLLEIEARLRRLAESHANPSHVDHRRSAPSTSPVLHARIEQALNFIHQHYTQEIQVKDIAADVDLHPKYLMYLFRQTCGISLWDYVLRLRVSHARRMLLAGDAKVVDVAFTSGFQNVASFYAAFGKSTSGITPLQYRKQMRVGE